jgi:transposase
MRRSLFWLNDEQWDRIEPYLPTDIRGVERADDRRVISGIVHVLKSGCRWCDCPPEYGPPTTIYIDAVRNGHRMAPYRQDQHRSQELHPTVVVRFLAELIEKNLVSE